MIKLYDCFTDAYLNQIFFLNFFKKLGSSRMLKADERLGQDKDVFGCNA